MRPDRDNANGRYVHTSEALCVCGHALGVHTAAVHKGLRPCLNADVGDGKPCACERFRKRVPK